MTNHDVDPRSENPPNDDPKTPESGGTDGGHAEPGRDVFRTTHFVRGALDGNADSLEWVVRRFTPILRAQAEYRLDRRLRSQVDPTDLVNDVWVRALPGLADFEFDGPRSTPAFLRYISQILLHQVNNLYRKHVRGKPIVMSRDDSVVDLSDPMVESARAISIAVRREEKSALQAALDALSPEDREVIVLRGIEQNTTAELAVLLGVKPNTISVRYRRALDRLRRMLPNSIVDELPEPDETAPQ